MDPRLKVILMQRTVRCNVRKSPMVLQTWFAEAVKIYNTLYVRPDKNDPPLLLIHGDQDIQMPVNQSLELEAVYEKKGGKVSFINVHGGAHGGAGFYEEAMLDRVVQFLGKSGL